MIEQSSTPPEQHGVPAPAHDLEKPKPRPTTKVPPLPPQGPPSKYRWVWWVVFVVVAVFGYLNWAAISKLLSPPPAAATGSGKKGGKGGGQGGPAPVVATKTTRGNIGVYFTGLGAVTPIYTVTVKSRVDGRADEIHYKEGDMVQQGRPAGRDRPAALSSCTDTGGRTDGSRPGLARTTPRRS